MFRALTLILTLLAAEGVSAEFQFRVFGSSEELTIGAVKSADAAEVCVAKQAGAVVVLLFVGHSGLVVDVRAAPKGTEDCIAKVFGALELGDAQPHEHVTVVGGLGKLSDFVVTWPSKRVDVIDQANVTAMSMANEWRAQRIRQREAFEHAPLFYRCNPGEHLVLLGLNLRGEVKRVTGTSDACVTEALKSLVFPEDSLVKLKVRLD